MRTEPLFYHDPLLRECEARVIAFDQVQSAVQLDRSCFYPEGGGQPGDRGLLRLTDGRELPIATTSKDATGAIWHRIGAAQPVGGGLEPGAVVRLQLDWQHRHTYMQQHTGQHLISAALKKIADLNTVAVAQGTATTAIEVDVEISDWALLEQVAAEVQEQIAADRAVRAFEVDEQELPRYRLRRPTERSGRVRLVEIADYDVVACGGVHQPRTALVQLVQPAASERIRSRSRLHWLIGERALTEYRLRFRRVEDAAALFSCHPGEVVERARAAVGEVQTLHGTIRRQAERIAAGIADGAIREGSFAIRLEREDEVLFAALTRTLCDRPKVCGVLTNRGERETRWAIVDTRSTPLDFGPLRVALLQPHAAKGGGRAPLWQGVLSGDSKVVTAFMSAFATLRQA